jgi:serine/threonine protein kinase
MSIHNTSLSPSSSSALSLQALSAFPQLTKALFPLITNYLTTLETSELEQTCSRIKIGVVYTRTLIRNIHLTHAQTNDARLPIQLEGIARQHPQLHTLKLDVTSLYRTGFHSLLNTPLLKQIVRITLYGDGQNVCRDDVDLLVTRINFSALELFDLQGAPKLPPVAHELLTIKLQSCEKLKILRLGLENYKILTERNILKTIFKTLEELGPFITDCLDPIPVTRLDMDDDLIDLFLNTCKTPELVSKCHVNIKEASPQKIQQFLQFLPLSQMSHLTLLCDRLSLENIDYLSSQLEINSQLIEYCIICNDIEASSIIHLLQSINSSNLETFLVMNMKEKFNYPEITGLSLQKIASFPKLTSLTLGNANLRLLQAAIRTSQSASSQ